MMMAETTETERTLIDGWAAAALLAVGAGAFVLGVVTTLNEASTGFSDFLAFDNEVGPLSGKTVIAAIAYGVSLVGLGLLWRGRQIPLRPVLVTAVVLLLLGLLGTFPPFFEAFAD
jgi:CHASE2 domain-containing sensor protein